MEASSCQVRSLKQQLHRLTGLPRFRQRLLHEGAILEDDGQVHEDMSVQLVSVAFADASDEQTAALAAAAGRGAVAEVEAILKRPQNPNATSPFSAELPLTYASRHGYAEVGRLLLEAGAVTNTGDKTIGNSALHEACMESHLEIVHMLLAHRANTTEINGGGSTALHCAARAGQTEAVQMLLEARVDTNIRNTIRGDTALHDACNGGHVEVARMLLATGAVTNARNHRGSTALHEAARVGWSDAVHVLLEAGVDQTLKDHRGKTALQVASAESHAGIIQLLSDGEPGTAGFQTSKRRRLRR